MSDCHLKIFQTSVRTRYSLIKYIEELGSRGYRHTVDAIVVNSWVLIIGLFIGKLFVSVHKIYL